MSVAVTFCLSVFPSVFLSVCLSVCLSLSLSQGDVSAAKRAITLADLPQWERDYTLNQNDELGLFNEYLEMVIQVNSKILVGLNSPFTSV